MQSLPQLNPGDRYDDLFFINAQTGYVIHILGQVYKTIDGGRNFTEQSVSSSRYRSIGFFNETTGIAGTLTESTPIMRTTNSGQNFTNVTAISGTIPLGICGISVLDSNTAFAVGIYRCPANFLRTTDQGLSWTSYNLDTSLIKSLVDCYFWSPDSGIVVGGYNPGNTFNISNSVVLFTSNGGQSFTQVFKSSRSGEWCWKINFINKNTGFVSVQASQYSVILKTTNSGLNWTDSYFTITKNLQGIGFINENTGWVGGYQGYSYATTNGGASWEQARWSLYINKIKFMSDSLGYCVGGSFYKYTQGPVSVHSNPEHIPAEIYLYQNYPNPFNPSTIINYELRLRGLITLKIYDTKGSEVITLLNQIQQPGIYSAEFNAASLPSGIYFYTLTADNLTQTKKMLLIK